MPTEDEVTRKLRAILSADVKGYSLLMADDEAFTVKTLKSYRKVMSAQIVRHKGRVVDTPGDNLLSEFASVVDAVQCAVEIQKILKEKNKDLPPDKRLEFRIGVNIGDVIQDEDSIYGAGVNVAARIEGLSDAGGISISRNAYDHVKDKLNYGYEYLGDHEVKNIKDPVRVYKVLINPADAGKLIGEKSPFSRKKWLWLAVATVAFLICVIVWQFSSEKLPLFEAASVENMAYPLPDKPSIAVLPFDNLSGDPDQEYFSDGLTEEIIAGLSKIPSIFVIARNSTFIYKGKPVKIQQVSEELGVRYVLEGSVRKEGNHVRITAQLIDAISGYHMWSKSYDRKLENIFELQNDIMRDILIEMQVQLSEGIQARVWHKTLQGKKINIAAYEKLMQSRWHYFRMNPEGTAMSKQLAEEALEIDPTLYGAYVLLTFINQENVPLAEKYALKALQLNDSYPMAHIAMGQVYLQKEQWEKAIDSGKRALELDPNGAEIHNHLGYFLDIDCRFEEAIPLYEKAIRLNPYPPSFYYSRLGNAYALVGKYDEAIDVCKKGLKRNPRDIPARFTLAAVYIWQDREEEAHAEVAEIFKAAPLITLSWLEANLLNKNKEILERLIEAWRKAGIPE